MNTEQHREPWEAITLFGAMPVATFLTFEGFIWILDTIRLYYYIL